MIAMLVRIQARKVRSFAMWTRRLRAFLRVLLSGVCVTVVSLSPVNLFAAPIMIIMNGTPQTGPTLSS